MMTKKSMAIDGTYIESIIDGYTTISVTGRESLKSKIDTVSVNNRHGSIYKGKTYESRTLSISFVIEGVDSDDLLEKLETLNEILDDESVTVSFVDESNRFYYVDAFTNPEASITVGVSSNNAVATGSFDAYCSNPFKYSTEEIVVDPEEDEDGYPLFLVDYDGTYKSYPTFEVDFYSKSKEDFNDELSTKEDDEDDAKTLAYDGVILDSEDVFNEDTYWIVEESLAKSYIPGELYFTKTAIYDSDDSATEEAEEGDDSDADTIRYILESGIDETYFEPDEEGDIPEYYTISLTPALSYKAGVRYFWENSEAISEEDINDLSTDNEPEEDEFDGLENEDVEELGVDGTCGYVAFVDDNANILQFGNPGIDDAIADGRTDQKLITSEFTKSSSFGSSMQAKWLYGGAPSTVYWRVTVKDKKAFAKGTYYTASQDSNGFYTYTQATTFSSGTQYYIKQTRTINGTYSEKLAVNRTYASLKNDQVLLPTTKTVDGIRYKVVLDSVTGRTGTSAKLNFKITATLRGATIWKKGKKYKVKKKYKKNGKTKTKDVEKKHGGTLITAHIIVGGNDYPVVLNKQGETWKKGHTKTKKKTITLSGLSSTTQSYSGMKFQVNSSGERNIQLKRRSMRAASLPAYIPMAATKYYLSPNFVAANGWHGPAIYRTIPADVNGETGAMGYKLEVNGKFCVGNAPNYHLQRGIMGVYVLDDSNRVIGGIEVCKINNTAGEAYIRRFYNNIQFGAISGDKTPTANYVKYSNGQSFTLSIVRNNETHLTTFNFKSHVPAKKYWTYQVKNKRTNKWVNKKTTSKSTAEKIQKKINKKKKGYRSFKEHDPSNTILKEATTSIACDATATKIAIAFYANGSVPHLDWCGITKVQFTKLVIDDAEESNIFHQADQLVVDCNTGGVLLNNTSALSYGALGNDWDDFYLDSGLNQIRVLHSTWSDTRMVPADTFDAEAQYYTKSGDKYVEANPSEEVFNADPSKYYISETFRKMVHRKCLHSEEYDSSTTYYTKTDNEYTEATPTEEQYNANPNNYYILEPVDITCRMRYREVFI